jgi:two-component system chemotaxis response regulator CheY
LIIVCEACNKRYKLDDSKVRDKRMRLKCPGCGGVIVVHKDQGETGGPRKKKIVVADDTRFFREMLTDMLNSNGYDVITAVDGEDAFQKVKHELPDLDLLILDMLMPKMDGFKVIEEIQKGVMGKNLPILALSGVFKSEEDRARMKEYGITGYIDKDTPPDEIIRRVKILLEGE